MTQLGVECSLYTSTIMILLCLAGAEGSIAGEGPQETGGRDSTQGGVGEEEARAGECIVLALRDCVVVGHRGNNI